MISINGQSIDIVNPENDIGLKNWNIVNDDVMGGISKSYLALNDENNLIFSGNVSLRNNGGFASTRMELDRESLNGIRFFKIKFRGDGNMIDDVGGLSKSFVICKSCIAFAIFLCKFSIDKTAADCPKYLPASENPV